MEKTNQDRVSDRKCAKRESLGGLDLGFCSGKRGDGKRNRETSEEKTGAVGV